METTPGYHRTGDCPPEDMCVICDDARAWAGLHSFTPDPCEVCGSTASCAHWDGLADLAEWSDEWLTPTELKAARAAEWK